jgi:alanine racemase
MLFIHKDIIKNNIIHITKKFNKIPAFVLKSDAYGLGIKNIFPILLNVYMELHNSYEGLFQIFVRNVQEGKLIRILYNKYLKENKNINININIIILNSIERKTIKFYEKYNLTSLINHKDEIEKFENIFKKNSTLINLDVGMNRTGIKYEEIQETIINKIKSFNIIGIMAHLHITHSNSYIDNINHIEKNKLIDFIKYFPSVKNITLASSNVLEFGEDFIFSQPRIGKAIYGLIHKNYGLKEAVSFKLKISQVNFIKTGEIVGYNGYKIQQDSYIGVVNIGYSQGLNLYLANNIKVKYKNKYYKIISVSMEYIMIDFQNTKVKKNIYVNLFSDGFVNEFKNRDFYYLEQLVRFMNFPKKIIN